SVTGEPSERRIKEGLLCTTWSRMQVTFAGDQSESGPTLFGQFVGRIALHGEAAAHLGTILRERRDDGDPARHDRPRAQGGVGRTIGWIGYEVEDGAIVPDPEPADLVDLRDVRRDPLATVRPATQSPLRHVEGC